VPVRSGPVAVWAKVLARSILPLRSAEERRVFIRLAIARVDDLLDGSWPTVQRVAAVLIDRDEMSPVELDALAEELGPVRPD